MDSKFGYEFRTKYLSKVSLNYHQLQKMAKRSVLNQAVALLGYNRKYLIHLLNRFSGRGDVSRELGIGDGP